jgi:hypothetical protein
MKAIFNPTGKPKKGVYIKKVKAVPPLSKGTRAIKKIIRITA